MAFLTVGKENSANIDLYYEDRGSGRPVVLVHGWPLNGASWERQVSVLLGAGFRVITYDRRGFGRSSAPGTGYDYNTFASDLAVLLRHLDIRDAALAGFSMAGGELARYMAQSGGERISKVCFISSIAPALRKDGNNPDGVDPAIFEGLKAGIEADRFAFLTQFLNTFYNADKTGISAEALRASWQVAAGSSAYAMLNCVDAWLEDFRDDVRTIKVPTLVIHGDSDQIVPVQHSGARMPQFVPHAKVHIIKNGPHGVLWTHATEVNKALLDFVR